MRHTHRFVPICVSFLDCSLVMCCEYCDTCRIVYDYEKARDFLVSTRPELLDAYERRFAELENEQVY